jgi:hypothetical protein
MCAWTSTSTDAGSTTAFKYEIFQPFSFDSTESCYVFQSLPLLRSPTSYPVQNDAVSKTFLHSDVAISGAPGMLESGLKLVVASM